MEQFKQFQNRIETVLGRMLPSSDTSPSQLHEAMRYSVLAGGKRIRPILVYATGTALGASLENLDPIAAAIEFIHCYSLVHDDLPAMDNDDLRRGKPTCHKAYNEAIAILVGDALQALAFECIAQHESPDISAQQKIAMLSVLTRSMGSLGMAGGQTLDIAANHQTINLTDLEQIHQLKTGALLSAAVSMGAITANCQDATLQNNLEQYAKAIGLAFQIQDDILDVIGTTAQLGKPQGSDQAQNKANFASLLGIDLAKERVIQLHKTANNAIEPLGDNGRTLLYISQFLMERDH